MKRPRRRKQPLTYENKNMLEGRYFSTGQLFTGVAAEGGTAVFVLENPSSSPKNLFLDPQTVRSEAKCYVRKYFGVSFSGGAAPDTGIVNKASDNGRTNNADAFVNPSSFSGGKQFSTKLVGSNAGGVRTGGGADTVSNIVQPGSNILIEVENQSSSTEDISIGMDWLEI